MALPTLNVNAVSHLVPTRTGNLKQSTMEHECPVRDCLEFMLPVVPHVGDDICTAYGYIGYFGSVYMVLCENFITYSLIM